MINVFDTFKISFVYLVEEAQLVKYNDNSESVKVVKDAELIPEDTVKIRQDAYIILMMSSRGDLHEKQYKNPKISR